jgi:predicted nucleic acid-binding protein
VIIVSDTSPINNLAAINQLHHQQQGDTEKYQQMQQVLENLEAILRLRSYARQFIQ